MNRSVSTRASAPGKLILAGEHSVVYGRPALVASVDRRVVAEVVARDLGVLLELPGLGFVEESSWQDVVDLGIRSKEAWLRYDADPNSESFRRLLDDDPARLVKLALAQAAAHRPGLLDQGLRLVVLSDLPTGSGLGSSAAVGAAVLAAALRSVGDEVANDELVPLALEVERHQHGSPSGLDTAAVVHGGVLSVVRGDRGLELTELTADPATLKRLKVVDSGRPADSTGEVVSGVRARLQQEPQAVEASLDDLAEATLEMRRCLESGAEQQLGAIVRRLHAGLCRLGVVPQAVRERVAAIERRGGAAKISGAGSLAGPGAGMLLVYDPEGSPGAMTRIAEVLDGYPEVAGRLGADGLKVEIGFGEVAG